MMRSVADWLIGWLADGLIGWGRGIRVPEWQVEACDAFGWSSSTRKVSTPGSYPQLEAGYPQFSLKASGTRSCSDCCQPSVWLWSPHSAVWLPSSHPTTTHRRTTHSVMSQADEDRTNQHHCCPHVIAPLLLSHWLQAAPPPVSSACWRSRAEKKRPIQIDSSQHSLIYSAKWNFSDTFQTVCSLRGDHSDPCWPVTPPSSLHSTG